MGCKKIGSSNLTHKSCGIFVASWGFADDVVDDDDGLDARAQARPSPDDVGHIQCLSRRHDACLEQLQARMGDGRDFLLQNAPLALVERVEVRRAKRPQ